MVDQSNPADWAKVIIGLEFILSFVVGIAGIKLWHADGQEWAISSIIASWFGLIVFLLLLAVYNLVASV